MNRLQSILLFAVLCFTVSIGEASAPGRTPGSFVVDQLGAATYTIPIWAPPGPRGIQPSIALIYSSLSGNGFVGVGWNLTGLSAISRCNHTYAQDGSPAPVMLSTSDGYCLDGQRLQLVSGTYGAAGSIYQTELATFQRITAVGTAGNGPASFTVQTSDGRTIQYGNGGNSQVLASGTSTALTWLENAVSDPAGNTLSASYTTATGSAVPSTISWTPVAHGSSTYAYTMQFSYGTNVQPTAGFVASTAVRDPYLLGSITISHGGSQTKQYILTYTHSGTTGRDLLTQIQECSASTSNCRVPTTVSYQSGAAGLASSATSVVGSPLTSCPVRCGAIVRHDFNGDGYLDLYYCTSAGCFVAFGSASGFGSPVSAPSSTLFGDMLAAGTEGILANNGGTWYYYTWNGSSFAGQSTGLSVDTSAADFAFIDVDGDGRPDLVTFYATSGVSATTRLNASTLTSPVFSASVVSALSDPSSTWGGLITADTQQGSTKDFDFNGDGLPDVVLRETFCAVDYMGTCIQYDTVLNALFAQPGGTFGAINLYLTTGVALPKVVFGNVNGDACTDVGIGQTIVISGCNGVASTTATANGNILAIMDWNGDGLGDFVEDGGTYLYVEPSPGAAATGGYTTIPYDSSCGYVAFNANGDGQDALGCASGASGHTGFAFYTHNSTASPPDLLTSILDANGNSASPVYDSVTRSPHYFWWNDAGIDSGYLEYKGPRYLVTQVTYSDPSTTGGTYLENDFYAAGWQSTQGRGFSGYGAHQIVDTRSDVWRTWGYRRDFPFTGLVRSVSVVQNNSTSQILESNNRNYGVTVPAAGAGGQFPYLGSVSDIRYEIGTSTNRLVTNTLTSYSYDGYGNATSITETVTDEDTGSAFYGQSWTTAVTNTPSVDTTHWCLNLMSASQTVFSISSGGPSITRSKSMSPDTISCHTTQIITEPSNPTYQVTETLGFDSFGNVNSDVVTGVGMAARTSLANWGTTGQFPVSVTDPSGAQTQYGYDLEYGKVSSITDANGLTRSFTYGDGFGHLTQENLPDGTYHQWTYQDCPAWGGCLVGSHGLAVAHYLRDTAGNLITDGSTYFDPVDRQILKNQLLMMGTYEVNETSYDSLGRVSGKSAPCFWVGMVSCPYWTTRLYDDWDRVTKIQRPISASNSTPQSTLIAYSGRTSIITDANGKQRTLVSDVNGWRRQTRDPLNYAINFGYDSAGSPTAITDSLGNTLWTGAYAYGLQSYLTSEADMDRGAWSYTYNALGERTAWTDATGNGFSQTFDALSRPVSRTEPDLFTHWTWGSSASNHNWGHLQSDCTGTGTACTSSGYAESLTYDSLGRKSQRAITIPSAGTFTYTWQYDAATGFLGSLIYPTSTSGYALTLDYAYQNGVLHSITDVSDSPNVTVWTATNNDAAGRVDQETLGNGIVTSRSYDAVTSWLSSIQSGVGSGAGVQNQSFLFDLVGNVIQRQDNNLGLTENFYYDNDYRLTSSTLNGTSNLTVGFDLMGNITSRSDLASGATWTYDPSRKHAVTQAGSSAYTYAYDANGNVASRQGSIVDWYTSNYPKTVRAGSGSTAETVAFSYGPDRSRWQQVYTGSSSPETTDYIGGLMDLVISGGVSDYRHYLYAGEEPLAVLSRKSSGGGTTVSYLLTDREGSIEGITNSSGGMSVNESFTPFGSRRNPTTWSGAASNPDLTTSAGLTRQGYTFQTQLGLWAGLNHMNGRVEDAAIGRFLSADPQGVNPDETQSFNRYSYVGNNPLTFFDPSGFDATNDYLGVVNGLDTFKMTNGSGQRVSGSTAGVSVGGGAGITFGSGNTAYTMTPGALQQLQEDVAAVEPRIVQSLVPSKSPPLHQGSTTSRALPEPALVGSFIGLDDLAGLTQSWLLDELGCSSQSCQLAATILLVRIPIPGKYTLTRTVESNLPSRPYLNSPLLIDEIRSTGPGVPDPGGIPGALRYDVPGTFKDQSGTWELVVDPSSCTVYHFLFVRCGE